MSCKHVVPGMTVRFCEHIIPDKHYGVADDSGLYVNNTADCIQANSIDLSV